jgi:hypothetical protein
MEMATLSTLFTVGSTIMQVAGAASQGSEMKAAAKANQRRAAAEKAQLDYMAGQEQAAGQHKAVEARRKAALMLSRAQAVAAASGAGAVDESLMGGILEEGEREAGYRMYESGERANTLRYKGEVGLQDATYQRKVAKQRASMTMMGAVAKAGLSLASLAPGAAPTDSMAGYKGEFSNSAYDVGNYS